MSSGRTICRIEGLENRLLLAYVLANLNFDSFGGAGLENGLKNDPDVNTAGGVAGIGIAEGIYDHAMLRVVRSGKAKVIDVGRVATRTNSYARGLNDKNQFVGDWTDSKGTNHAFISVLGASDRVGLIKLGDVKGLAGATAYAINNSGLIVGSAGMLTGKEQATAWVPVKGGTFTTTPLPRLGNVTSVPGYVASSIALDVNDKGSIVGMAVNSNLQQRAALWTRGTRGFGVTDLGSLTGGIGFSYAYAINSLGVVAGSSAAKDLSQHAVLFVLNSKGKYSIADLGNGGSTYQGAYATDVNTAGVVVGAIDTAGGDRHAVLWTGSRGKYTRTDLNTLLPKNSKWVLEQATGINDAGVIVGSGLFQGGIATWVLTPKGKGTAIQLASINATNIATPAPSSPPSVRRDVFSNDPIDASTFI